MKTVKSCLIVLLFTCFGVPAVAQKDEGSQDYGIFASQQEYHRFMGDVKSNPELSGMVDVINDIVLQRPIGSTNKEFGISGSTLGLLSDAAVRDDLEMMDDQYEQLQRMNEQLQQRAAEQLRNMNFRDPQELLGQIRKIRAETDNELNTILLPHQLTRLRQIRTQSGLRGQSLVDVITSEPVKSKLEISDRQADRLRQDEREIQEELEREIAELRERAREKLLSSLKREQRKKVDEMFGETFSFREDRESGRRRDKSGSSRKNR